MERLEELEELCAEAYQVVGVLANIAGVFETEAVEKALDNLSEMRMVHLDVLPFDPEQAPVAEAPDFEDWWSAWPFSSAKDVRTKGVAHNAWRAALRSSARKSADEADQAVASRTTGAQE